MEYTIIGRSLDAFQQPVAREYIIAMCRRAFGEEIQIESVKELDGGLCNNIYLIHINGMQPVILRVGPHSARPLRGEENLMRNELASLPFLAPIAPFLPRILMADFTHQILERDYMFQTFIEGEQWARIKNEFTMQGNQRLWRFSTLMEPRGEILWPIGPCSFCTSIPGPSQMLFGKPIVSQREALVRNSDFWSIKEAILAGLV